MRNMNRVLPAVVFAVALLAGCATEKPKKIVQWPDPPEKARIRFVQALRTPKDLKAGARFGDVSRAILGSQQQVALVHPMGLALSEDGNRLYVADLRGSMVYVMDFVAKTMKEFQPLGTFQHPCNVALDAEENVYVSDIKAVRITAWTKDGRKLMTFGTELERPTGLALDKARKVLYVVDTSRVRSPNHRVFAYGLDGKVIREIGRGRGTEEQQFNFPSYVALDNDGNVYVADSMNFRVQVFDPEGRFIRAFGEQGMRPGQFSRMKGIDVDGFGNVYVADGEHAVVQMFNKNFDRLMYFGGRINALEYFDVPSAIAIDRRKNRIYVANEIFGRVNVYDLVNTTAEDSFTAAAPAKTADASDAKGKPE
jgi:DNA-binding beta-propeller fold protein YncE